MGEKKGRLAAFRRKETSDIWPHAEFDLLSGEQANNSKT
jgi:hypothetical protein